MSRGEAVIGHGVGQAIGVAEQRLKRRLAMD